MGLQEIRALKLAADLPKIPKQYSIPKKSKKKIAQEAEHLKDRKGQESELVKWYRSKMLLMSGNCAECGKGTNNKRYELAIHSICHLLAKRKTVCPSVATNENNWIELCPDCHYKFDNTSWDDISKWGCFNEIRERLSAVYHYLKNEEKRHFPEIVLKWMQANPNLPTPE